jgi:PAS domain S-box-containing protein
VAANSQSVELRRFIGTGPSIRSRVRLALALALLVAVPALFVGVLRTEKVLERTVSLMKHDDYVKKILEARLAMKELDLALLAFFSEQELGSGQNAVGTSNHVVKKISRLVRDRPHDIDIGPPTFLEGLANRLNSLTESAVANRSSVAPARLNIIALYKELNLIEQRVMLVSQQERKLALVSLSSVGRDQLILFLILLFAIPIFVVFVPGWVVGPLSRLKQIANKIELGQLKDIAIRGHDEVAILTRSLKTYFIHQEALEHKKSSKIFEMRNILRSVLSKVQEPIFIVDNHFHINYANEAAALLVGLPSHQVEGKVIGDCMFCPTVKKALERALAGDATDVPLLIKIEVADGRIFEVEARLGVVRNRDGEVSRAVIVLHELKKETIIEDPREKNIAYPG